VWRVSQFDPGHRLGWKRGVALFLTLTFVGNVHVWSCYVFDVTISNSSVKPGDSIEVRARVSGRITEHDLLAAQASAVRGSWRSPVLDFNSEEPGTYVTWLDMRGAPAGIYRLTVFFREPKNASALERWGRKLTPQKFQRSFIVRVM
jgi:hypothetical protein